MNEFGAEWEKKHKVKEETNPGAEKKKIKRAGMGVGKPEGGTHLKKRESNNLDGKRQGRASQHGWPKDKNGPQHVERAFEQSQCSKEHFMNQGGRSVDA